MREILDLIETVYDAPADHGAGWHRLIDQFGALFPHCKTVLGTYRQGEMAISQSATDIPIQFLEDYADYYVFINPVVPPLMNSRGGDYFDADDFVEREALLRSEIYDGFWKPLGDMDRNIGVVLENQNGMFSTFCTHFSDRYEPDDGGLNSEHVVRTLMPHLRRAVHLQHRLEMARHQADSLSDALDLTPAAILIVNAAGRVRYRNAGAERLARRQTPFRIGPDGRLKLADPKSDEALRRQIRALTSIDDFAAAAESLPLTVELGSGETYALTARPAPSSLAPGRTASQLRERRVILSIRQIGAAGRVTADAVGVLLGLTNSESRLAVALYEGRSLNKIASRYEVSVHTVRNQLKSVFSKTGTARQSELVRLIASLSFLH